MVGAPGPACAAHSPGAQWPVEAPGEAGEARGWPHPRMHLCREPLWPRGQKLPPLPLPSSQLDARQPPAGWEAPPSPGSVSSSQHLPAMPMLVLGLGTQMGRPGMAAGGRGPGHRPQEPGLPSLPRPAPSPEPALVPAAVLEGGVNSTQQERGSLLMGGAGEGSRAERATASLLLWPRDKLQVTSDPALLCPTLSLPSKWIGSTSPHSPPRGSCLPRATVISPEFCTSAHLGSQCPPANPALHAAPERPVLKVDALTSHPLGWLNDKKKTENKCQGGRGETGTLMPCRREGEMARLRWRTVWRFLKKLNTEILYDPAIPLLSLYPKVVMTNICVVSMLGVIVIHGAMRSHTRFCVNVSVHRGCGGVYH